MSVEQAELIAHVEKRLAKFKAPRYVLVVESMARTPSGKLDYGTLRDVGVSALDRLKAERATMS